MRKMMAGIVVAGFFSGYAAIAQQAQPVAAAPAAPAAAPVQKTWVDSVTVKGDVRYRIETIDDASKLDSAKETYTRERDRIRARLGAEAKVSDTLKGGIELSTGQSDPVSGNQTIGDTFGKKDMKLNLAYLDWALVSQDSTSVNLIAGKMKNPFINVSDLVWDGDVTPEGLALKAQTGNDLITAMANGAYMWVKERDKASDDSMLYAGQGAIKFQPLPEFYAMLGASYYGYQKMKGYDVQDWEAKNNTYGNSSVKGTIAGTTTNKAYACEFTPVEIFAELGGFIGKIPVALFGQTVSNGDADKLKNGFLYGLSVGKAKNPKTFEVGYAFAEVEKDALVGALTDSDRWGGGTDGHGNKVWTKYQISKNLQAGATYFTGEKTLSDSAKTKDYDRLQLDIVFSF